MGQVNNIQLKINLKRNNNRKSDYYGKLYGYTETQNTLSMRGLAKHISDHGTIFTRDIVEGVITKLCECIPNWWVRAFPSNWTASARSTQRRRTRRAAVLPTSLHLSKFALMAQTSTW